MHNMKKIVTEEGKTISIQMNRNLYGKNEELAKKNWATFNRHHIHAVDILGSIGSGKTSTIQQLVYNLKERYRIAAIAGDLTTTIDADRIREKGANVLQVNTDGGCHLDANIIQNTLKVLDLDSLDLVFIENVGNLICPASFPLGAHQRLVVVSVTEGPYMIVKHPHIFQGASVLAINKIDLAKAMDVDPEQLKADARRIQPNIHVVSTNARTGEGIPELIDALKLK